MNAAPYFIFGDFNFRTDTGGVVKVYLFFFVKTLLSSFFFSNSNLYVNIFMCTKKQCFQKVTEELTACRLQNGANVDTSKLQYRSKSDDRIVLTIGKKEFAHVDHQKIFREPWVSYTSRIAALKILERFYGCICFKSSI